MPLKLEIATEDQAREIAALHCDVSGGQIESAVKDVMRRMRHGKVYAARRKGKAIATLCLTSKKPWAIDTSYFTPIKTPLYLIAMAVAPSLQRKGVGRRCLLEADRIAAQWPADAIRLDAYDSPTGAGGFYHLCGYREVGRAAYRGTPLIYFERLICNQ